MKQETSNESIDEETSGNYYLVTYNQSAESISYVESIKVNAKETGEIAFVIGNVDSNGLINERVRFVEKCEEGENELKISEKYIVKQGEYLFMDASRTRFFF